MQEEIGTPLPVMTPREVLQHIVETSKSDRHYAPGSWADAVLRWAKAALEAELAAQQGRTWELKVRPDLMPETPILIQSSDGFALWFSDKDLEEMAQGLLQNVTLKEFVKLRAVSVPEPAAQQESAIKHDEIVICEACRYSTDIYNSASICDRCLRAEKFWSYLVKNSAEVAKFPKWVNVQAEPVPTPSLLQPHRERGDSK